MCEFESLKDYAQSLRQRDLDEDAKLIKRIEKQGGKLRPAVVRAVENNLSKSEVFRRAKKGTKNETHFSGKKNILRECRRRFERKS